MSQEVENIKPGFPLFRGQEYRENLDNKKKLYEDAHDAKRIKEVFEWTTSQEYQELNFKREALTVNPAKACQPLGAVLCALGFEKTLPYVHGSQGCVAYFRTYFKHRRCRPWAPKHPHPSLYRSTAPPRRPPARSAANSADGSGLACAAFAPSPTRPSSSSRSPTASTGPVRVLHHLSQHPRGVLPKAQYYNRVRDLVLDRILQDGMNIERALVSIRREFLLDLSSGFVYDVLRHQAAQLDMAAHRRKVLEHFSGTLCVDELHLGRFTLLLATDPLSDLPVAFALVAANDQDHMRRFLKNLQTWGLNPQVVVTDGSNLYPAVLEELWPDADHQLCVFHVIKAINKLILDAVRRLRSAMNRRGKAGRKKKRGRKGAKSKAAAARRGMTVKEKRTSCSSIVI